MDVVEGLGKLAAPEQALVQRGRRVVLIEVRLEVAVAGFAEEDAVALQAEISERTSCETTAERNEDR